MELLEHLRIDDPVGAWPVHGLCGIWGTLSLGLFACGQYSAAGSSPTGVPNITPHSPEALTGLFYGGGMAVLKAQFIGSAIVCSATFAAAMVMFKALDAIKLLRVSAQGELEGFDLDQHGASAYPEYVISTLTAGHAVDGTTGLADSSLAPAK
jgi:Amt family ammonium transporter